MVKKTRKNKRRNNKSKKYKGGNQMTSQVGSQVSSQMRPNVRQMGDQLSSQMRPNVRQMGDQLSSQLGDQMTSQLGQVYNQATNIFGNVVVPAYKEFLTTGIDAAKKIALKEYNVRVDQLKIANEAAKKLIGTSEHLQQTAEQTGHIMENVIDGVGDAGMKINPILQQVQKGGKHIIKRINKSKEDFAHSGIPEFDIIEIVGGRKRRR
jgi:gas vesicle protein